MKTVKRLKDKHRDRIWLDSTGFVWFYHDNLAAWDSLNPAREGYQTFGTPATAEMVDRVFGPYTEIARNGLYT